MTISDKSQDILKNEPSFTVFNDAIKTVFKFYCVDNWLYTLVLLGCLTLAGVVIYKCNKADNEIEKRDNNGPMEKVLQRISIEVGKSCSSTIWSLLLAVFIMLTPTLIRASNDEKTQAIVNVLGFIPGVVIGLVQLYSAYKIIEYVLSKLPTVAANASDKPQVNNQTKG